MARYRYISCHPVTREQLDPSLRLIDPEWSWVVGGNGTLSAKITVPSDPRQVEKIKLATEPKQAAIYVRNNVSGGGYPWGGFVVGRSWDPQANQIRINCVEWRGWPYLVTMANTDPKKYFEFIGQDQLSIARQLMSFVQADFGSPPMTSDATQTSGKLRDLSMWGTELKKAGAAIDSIANRDGGFEWTIDSRIGNDGLPYLHFLTSFPQRGSLIDGLLFKHTPGGGNIIIDNVSEDVSARLDRFYATGAGQPPDQKLGWDFNPELAGGRILRFDGGSNFNSVSEVTTLTSHARRARKYYEPGVNLLEVTTGLDRIDVDSYNIGDRGRLQLEDRWMSLDLPAVRIIEKRVTMAGPGKVKLLLDLADFTLPEVDAGGAI